MAEYVTYKEENPTKMYKVGKYTFSQIEVKHLSLAMIMIILTIFAFQQKSLFLSSITNIPQVALFFVIYFFTVGLGFLLHELGHKFVAQKYGFISEFRADFSMLFIMFGVALFSPFILLAPGAVMILGRPTIKQNGIISIAGPIVNLILAAIFIVLSLVFQPQGVFGLVTNLGIWINAFLGVFNMLPFWILDGKKVLAWSKPAYFTVMGLLILILIGSWNSWF